MNWNNKRKVLKKLKRNFFMEAMIREIDLEYKRQLSKGVKETLARKKLSTP